MQKETEYHLGRKIAAINISTSSQPEKLIYFGTSFYLMDYIRWTRANRIKSLLWITYLDGTAEAFDSKSNPKLTLADFTGLKPSEDLKTGEPL